MTTVKEIEEALEKLPKNRLVEFREWFEKFDGQQWDQQFKLDVAEGKLDALANDALSDLENGSCTEL